MKKKAISTIARGKRAKVAVFKGSKESPEEGSGCYRRFWVLRGRCWESGLRVLLYRPRPLCSWVGNAGCCMQGLYGTGRGMGSGQAGSREEKTSTGLHKTDLMKNKSGRVVTKKQHAKGKALFQQFAKKWLEACMQARKELGLKGFCAIGGKSAQGKALYAKAKAIHAA